MGIGSGGGGTTGVQNALQNSTAQAPGVQDLVELAALDENNREDKQVRLVEDERDEWRWDEQSVAAAGAGVVLADDAPATGRWIRIGQFSGFIRGLGLEYVSALSVRIEPGRCAGDSGRFLEILSPVVVDITASGANGLDTGAEAVDTWYYVHVIGGGGNPVAGLLSASAAAPTLPGTYTDFRRVGVVRNDTGGDIISFVQQGDGATRDYRYTNSVGTRAVLFAGSAVGAIATVSAAAFVPPTTRFGSMWFRERGTSTGTPFSGVLIYDDPTDLVAENYIGLLPVAAAGDVLADPDNTGNDAFAPLFTMTSLQTFGYVQFAAVGKLDVWVMGFTESI